MRFLQGFNVGGRRTFPVFHELRQLAGEPVLQCRGKANLPRMRMARTLAPEIGALQCRGKANLPRMLRPAPPALPSPPLQCRGKANLPRILGAGPVKLFERLASM